MRTNRLLHVEPRMRAILAYALQYGPRDASDIEEGHPGLNWASLPAWIALREKLNSTEKVLILWPDELDALRVIVEVHCQDIDDVIEFVPDATEGDVDTILALLC